MRVVPGPEKLVVSAFTDTYTLSAVRTVELVMVTRNGLGLPVVDTVVFTTLKLTPGGMAMVSWRVPVAWADAESATPTKQTSVPSTTSRRRIITAAPA